MDYFQNFLDTVANKNWKKCAYGLGIVGKSAINDILPKLGIEFDMFCDKSLEVLTNYPVDVNKKITYDNLQKQEENIALFVLVGIEKCDEVVEQFLRKTNIHIITWKEIENSDTTIKAYFNLKKINNYFHKFKNENNAKNIVNLEGKKIAVFTYISDNYDKLNKLDSKEINCDYYLITDNFKEEYESDYGYKQLSIDSINKNRYKSGKEINRFCKTHGFDLFPQYDYSIYVDGSISIKNDISQLIGTLTDIGIGFHSFPYGDDVYRHALSLSNRKRIRKEDACFEMKKMSDEGFPRHYGMCECGVIISEHKNELGKQILNEWFGYYHNALAKRDQLYLPFILWRHGIEVAKVATLPGNLRNNGYFELYGKHTGFQE